MVLYMLLRSVYNLLDKMSKRNVMVLSTVKSLSNPFLVNAFGNLIVRTVVLLRMSV